MNKILLSCLSIVSLTLFGCGGGGGGDSTPPSGGGGDSTPPSGGGNTTPPVNPEAISIDQNYDLTSLKEIKFSYDGGDCDELKVFVGEGENSKVLLSIEEDPEEGISNVCSFENKQITIPLSAESISVESFKNGVSTNSFKITDFEKI